MPKNATSKVHSPAGYLPAQSFHLTISTFLTTRILGARRAIVLLLRDFIPLAKCLLVFVRDENAAGFLCCDCSRLNGYDDELLLTQASLFINTQDSKIGPTLTPAQWLWFRKFAYVTYFHKGPSVLGCHKLLPQAAAPVLPASHNRRARDGGGQDEAGEPDGEDQVHC
ncbi:hypothetical protein MBM_07853 [Drepanopeziza brunnea f. sp. 'multigermtubi' MB_m1]|uniref:Uncharacterized protein n=1 Tax=Marssonina brunnea f. sp. multigermtubi (strain MB_m1) TaxID=1072389 RepID=K1WMV6_MARBU|nr:uncharacterized protein MBM_07853 [Drepanopeziza brunnea f. sp. 'multigermtubi' MB_m1]EKD14176.1 hypothetical protein MBM_07853 [Drepanopeziza brunnea f. sp. 'multigermtubi' MB_m1]